MWCMIDVRPNMKGFQPSFSETEVLNVWLKVPLSSACIIREQSGGRPFQMDVANNLTFLDTVQPFQTWFKGIHKNVKSRNSFKIIILLFWCSWISSGDESTVWWRLLCRHWHWPWTEVSKGGRSRGILESAELHSCYKCPLCSVTTCRHW